jgi:hypothetical protein
MKKTQSGVSLGGLLIVLALIVIIGIFSLKLIPVYIEYFKAKAAIVAIARERQGATVADIRKGFDARATIDDIESVKSQDLEITKEGNSVVVSFAYRKEIAFGSNIGVYIDFSATSKEE